MNNSFLTGLLADAWTDLHSPNFLWQAGVIAFCLGLAWLAARSVKRQPDTSQGARRVGRGSINRLAFPLTALVLVLAARPILGHWQHVNMLSVAATLLLSLATIRIAVYALREILGESALLVVFERAIVLLIFSWVAADLLGLIPDIVDTLESVSVVIGKQRISLWVASQGLFWITVTLLAALWGGDVIESRLMRAASLHSSLRVVLSRLIKALLMIAAIMISLPMVGIDLTVLSVFGGALGVGLGLGLQRVASNYVSGFIILLDRSIRMGDLISVGERKGIVTNITTRYTVIKSLDGAEAIVPNDTLTTTPVINYSYSDKKIGLATQVRVAYGTDLDAVLLLLQEIASHHPRVLADPPPLAYALRFADSGIDLEVGYSILDPESGSVVLNSDLMREILCEFGKRGIEIPVPRSEVALTRKKMT